MLMIIRVMLLSCLFYFDLTFGQTSFSSHFSFDYSYVNTNINHSETSTDLAFNPLNEDVNIMVHYFGMGYEYELFASSLISLTTQFSLGFQSGEDVHYNEGSSGMVDFTTKASGHHGSAGLSLNWNSNNSFGKIQYFIGARTTSSKTKFFLRYDDMNTTNRSDEIQYDILQTITESSIGFRSFVFGEKNLYSTFSINKCDFNVQEFSAQAFAGKTDYHLNKLAEFKNQEYSIRFGFGFLY